MNYWMTWYLTNRTNASWAGTCAKSAKVKPGNSGFGDVVLLLLDQAPLAMYATLLESLMQGLLVKNVFGHNLLHPGGQLSPGLVPP